MRWFNPVCRVRRRHVRSRRPLVGGGHARKPPKGCCKPVELNPTRRLQGACGCSVAYMSSLPIVDTLVPAAPAVEQPLGKGFDILSRQSGYGKYDELMMGFVVIG